ncbi:hypothetical protein GCM10007424_00700 [Flavobacterium suaedae]|uniref:Uncharacterized protein n=1 Tax=Flavobacterium suaedae TaxID=1767027 RepID=A0ABQ1JBG8_9FLAO|nr:hypothetical protein [Flavobacterium suaedae]GGB64669.1 hypothetical protein GCM10007424_00700 [Flavobacterium suaedae]
MIDKNQHKAERPSLQQQIHALRLRTQLAWVEWMEAKAARLSRKGQYLLLGLFMAVSAGFCTLMLFGGLGNLMRFNAKPAAIRSVDAPRIRSSKVAPNDSLLQERLAIFHHYWDSLSLTVSGRKTRDSLLQTRPGLLDSISIAEQLIATQKHDSDEKQ